MEVNKGELILNHYSSFLGDFSASKSFAGANLGYPIQFLMYNNVFARCKTFITLGISKYSKELKNACEIMFVVDNDEDKATDIFANALFFLISEKIELSRGTYVSGIENVDYDFEKRHKKCAIYFSNVYCLPEKFSIIDKKISVLLGFFITREELDFLKENGYECFEEYLQQKNCDVFEIDR